MDSSKNISIIVPAYNEEETIGNCIDSLINQDTTINYEIIVVNDGSTDNTKKLIETYTKNHPNIYLYSKHNSGKGSAQNLGLEKSTGELILITDADAVVEKDWISKMATALKRNDLVMGTCYSENNSNFIEKIQNSFYLIKFKYGGLKGRATIGVNNGFNRNVVEKIGYFDESKTSVTGDFIKRAENANLKISFHPEIVVYTKTTTSFCGVLKQKLRWRESPLASIRKNDDIKIMDVLSLLYTTGLSLILFISLIISFIKVDLIYFFLSFISIYLFSFFLYSKSFYKMALSKDRYYTTYFLSYLLIEMIIRIIQIPYYVYRLIKPRNTASFDEKR